MHHPQQTAVSAHLVAYHHHYQFICKVVTNTRDCFRRVKVDLHDAILRIRFVLWRMKFCAYAKVICAHSIAYARVQYESCAKVWLTAIRAEPCMQLLIISS